MTGSVTPSAGSRVIDGTLAVRLGVDALVLVHATLLSGRSISTPIAGWLARGELLAHGVPPRAREIAAVVGPRD